MSRPQGAGTAGRAGLAEVARGSTLNLAGAIVSAAATLATTLIVTRHFSRAVAGAFVSATSLFLIVEALAGLGAANGAVYFIARLRPSRSASRSAGPGHRNAGPGPQAGNTGRRPGTDGSDGRAAAILRAAVRPVLVASVLSAGLMLVFAEPLARLVAGGPLARSGAAPGPAADAIRALAVAVPFAALADTFLGASRGFRNMLPTVAVDRIARPAAQIAGLVAAVTVGRAALLAPLWSLPYIPASLAAWFWLRRIRRSGGRGPHPASAAAAAAAPAEGQAAAGRGPYEVPPALAVLLALSRPVPPPREPAVAALPREPITQPLWYPGDPGLPWHEPSPWQVCPPCAVAAPEPEQDGDADGPGAAGFWAFTAPRAVAAVAQIVLQRLDIVLVAVLSGPAQAAVYAAATRFLVAGQLANAALIQAAQPQLSHLFGIGDRAAAGAVYQATTAWLIVLTWPLYLLSALFGPQLLAVFGRSYSGGATVVVILALAMLLATACGQVDLVLITAGRSRWSLLNGLLAVFVNVTVDVALIPRAGITGAAIGWAAALVVSNLVPLVQVAWVARVHPFGRGPAAAIAVMAVAFGAIPLAARAGLGPGPVASVAGVAAGALAAAAGLWCCRGALRLAVLPGLSPAARRAPKSPDDKGKDERQQPRPGSSVVSWPR